MKKIRTKESGFTLAEVLITLGIIGVVAAMTIPTLIANTNGAKFRAQFKKTLSTLNQAGLMSMAQYDFDYAGAKECGNPVNIDIASQNPENEMTFCSLLNGTLTGYTVNGKLGDLISGSNYEIKSRHALPVDAILNAYITYSLADGSLVAFSNSTKGGTVSLFGGGSIPMASCELRLGESINSTWIDGHQQCLGFIDVNGITLPNKEVTCTDGTLSATTDKAWNVDEPCAVKNDAVHMTDIFPIVFHDATVEPASNAAKYILNTSK